MGAADGQGNAIPAPSGVFVKTRFPGAIIPLSVLPKPTQWFVPKWTPPAQWYLPERAAPSRSPAVL